jgi:ligand-binding sensor protein
MVRGQPLRDAGDLPLARTGPLRVRRCDQGEARRPVHDPEQDIDYSAPTVIPGLLFGAHFNGNLILTAAISIANPKDVDLRMNSNADLLQIRGA